MSASTFTRPKLEGAALSPLVYWLLLVSGLAGITVMRFGSFGNFVTSDDVFALWAGSVGGVAFGQLVSWARVRIWVPLVVAMFGFWFLLPILFLVVDGIFGATAQTFALAFLPASICGYLSLTERGALVSFWYPAVLWMIVILDGPTPGTYDSRFALPFVVGLAALFVVYFRARESRRVAIWKAHGNTRLAESMPRTVLRSSPLRGAAQHVWSAMVAASALVLTAWIAPHLWQTVEDPARVAAHSAAKSHSPYGSSWSRVASKPCCPYGVKKKERVKEYFPLKNTHTTDDDADLSDMGECRVCGDSTVASNENLWGSGVHFAGQGPGFMYGDDTPSTWGGAYGSGSATTTTPSNIPTTTTTTTTSTTPTVGETLPPAIEPKVEEAAPIVPSTHAPINTTPGPSVAKPSSPKVAVPDPGPKTTQPVAGSSATEGAVPVPPTAAPAGTSIELPAPWKSSLGLCTIVFAFILASRALRRAVTLRHLARPFWNESFDQRISNHWERMLIGLRDAGLEMSDGEQPLAFARRIGIEGMEACATILERVRHGVRAESDDLSSMAATTDNVFRAARLRAGLAGRATAWMRGPLT